MTDRRALRLLGACVAALPLLTLLFLPIETIDDAFITFRYARNLGAGHGLVFNLGEQVEGVTSLSWTLLLAVVETLRLPVAAGALVLGVSFALLALRETYLLGRRLGASPAACLTAAALLAVHGRYWLVAANGLEGGLFSFLVILVTRKTVEGADARLIGAGLGLLFVTRPESLVILPLVLLYQILGTHRKAEVATASAAGSLRPGAVGVSPASGWVASLQRMVTPDVLALRSGGLRRWSVIAATALTIVATTTIWRLSYYGALLPNSVVAKSVLTAGPVAILDNFVSGLFYLGRFAAATAPLVLGAAVALVRQPKHRALWFSLLVAASEVPAVLANGGDWMPHYRLVTVFAPLLAALLACCLSKAFEDWELPGRSRLRAARVLVMLTLGAAFMVSRSPWQTSPGPRFELHPITSCYQFMATRLSPYLAPDDIAASEAVGLFGWLLKDTKIHDPLGLTSAHHARHGEYHGNWGKTDFDHLREVRPAILVAHEGSMVTPEKLDLATGGRFTRDYSAWFVSQPPSCDTYRLIVHIDNRRLERLRPALDGLLIEPLGAE